jgi:hypothetical protein
MMKLQKLTLAAVLSVGVLGTNVLLAEAADGILHKVQAGNTNYCHLKFPAIREDTLHMDRPVLQSSSTGDVVDFYGPCDYDPTGKAALQAQRIEKSRRFNREYAE